MSERELSDMIFYVIAGLVAMVLMNLVWKWLTGAYVEAIKDAKTLR